MVEWTTPIENWVTGDAPVSSDFNRIEGNEHYLKDAVDTEIVDRGNAVSSAIAAEQNARIAADTSEQNARIAADTSEQNARIAADSTLQTNINRLTPSSANWVAFASSSNSYALPSGGVYAWFYMRGTKGTYGLTINGTYASVSPGGTTIYSGDSSHACVGFYWKISD